MGSHSTRKARKKKVIAKSEMEIIRDLEKQIKQLKMLPDDFRDIEIGSRMWQLYRTEFPKQRAIMETWQTGGILCYESLEPKEFEILNFGREANDRVVRIDPLKMLNEIDHTVWLPKDIARPSWTFLTCLLYQAASANCSWIYFKSFTAGEVDALNMLLSRTHAPVRAKMRLEGKGHTTPSEVY